MLTINITQKEDLDLAGIAELVGMGTKAELSIPYKDRKLLIMFTKSIFGMLLNKHAKHPECYDHPSTQEIEEALNCIQKNEDASSLRDRLEVEDEIAIDDALISIICKHAPLPFSEFLVELNISNLEKDNDAKFSKECRKSVSDALRYLVTGTAFREDW